MRNLKELYDDLISKDITCEEAAMALREDEIRVVINTALNSKDDEYNKYLLDNILDIIKITQYIYNNSGTDTGLDDAEYDILYEYIKSRGINDIVSAPIKNKNVVYHKYPNLRGSLSKIYYLSNDEVRKNPSRKYLSEWVNSISKEIYQNSGQKVDLMNEEVHIYPKFDGVSAIFEMNADNTIGSVLTRGYTDANEAEDISHIFTYVPKRTHNEFGNKPYGLKTEIMMTEENLEKFNNTFGTTYKNTRSVVSAILNSDESNIEKNDMLTIVQLRVGDETGLEMVAKEVFEYPNLSCRLCDIDKIREFAHSVKYVNGLRTDGIVIRFKNHNLHDILGRENHINKYEIAYKFAEETAVTTITDVIFTTGLFGRITPVAKVKPVKLKGNTVTDISLGSIKRFEDLNLSKDDEVLISYDIIPYLEVIEEGRVGCKRFIAPTHCPTCGEELVRNNSGSILTCEGLTCPAREKGKIINYLKKMDIENISSGIVEILYDLGYVKNIKDLYKIEKHKHEIANTMGFGPKSVDNIIDAIKSKDTVFDYQLLGSLGIPNISRRIFKKILAKMDINELLVIVENNDIHALISIKGIESKSADKIIKGISANKSLIKYLRKTLNVNDSQNEAKSLFKVCFTKFRDQDLETQAKEIGIEISNSFNNEVDILVIPDKNTRSSKVSKAEKNGKTKVLTVDTFKNLVTWFADVDNFMNKFDADLIDNDHLFDFTKAFDIFSNIMEGNKK